MENKNFDMFELSAEQKEAAEKFEAIFSDEENKKKISEMRSAEDVIAFYEENGFSYTDADKDKIREAFDELVRKDNGGELTEDELADVAGGWGWSGFFSGSAAGAILGGFVGVMMGSLLASNPVGWAVGGALVCAGVLGVGLGAAID